MRAALIETFAIGGFQGLHLDGIIARLWVAIMDWVPLGYEDETGFHLGTGIASH